MLPQQTHRDNSLLSYSRPNNFNYQPRTEREKFNTYTVHTPPEQQVYETILRRSRSGTKTRQVRQYTNEEILKKSSYKDVRTISRAIKGLLEKGSIELVSNKGRSHYGTSYWPLLNTEIYDLRQTPEWQERQNGISNARKALTVLMVLRLHKLARAARKGYSPSPPNAPTGGGGNGGNAPSALTLNAPTAPVENEDRVLSVPASEMGIRVHQDNQQENFILIHEFRELIESDSGGGLVNIHARGDASFGAERQEDEKAASQSGNFRREVPSQSRSRQTKKEAVQKTDCEFRTKSAEQQTLESEAIEFMGYGEIVLDENYKGTIRALIAWCKRQGITAEILQEYRLWWWKSGRTKPPKFDWLRDTYPVFKGDLSRQQTGTPAAAPQESRVAQEIEIPQEPAPAHSPFWQDCLEKIKPMTPSVESFNTWFAPLNAEREGSEVTVFAPDRVFRDWLESNFAEVLKAVGLTNCRWNFAGGAR